MKSHLLKSYLVLPLITGMIGACASLALAQTTPPKAIHTVAPEYPETAIRSVVDPTVLVKLTIPPDGIPKDVKIAKGYRPEFDQSALEAVRQWRFKPAMKDGKPVQVTVTLQVVFQRR
jgi:periplasmic protein TonB